METTAQTKSCERCAEPLPPDAPEGLCPKCLMAAGMAKTTVESEGGSQVGAAQAPREIAQHFPQLEILELLGQGGMGMVYKARQPNLDRPIALKILPLDAGKDPAFRERFCREARALARLTHPGIVAIYDFGRAGPYYFLAMQFIDGCNLHELMRAKSMSPADALSIVTQICEALQYAHDEGVVHRDIKPGNILIDKKGRVKIADFGLAKLVHTAVAEPTLTKTGGVMGTPRYMAPEQFDHPEAVDHRADIYSLGVVFYELLTGEVPMGRFAPPSQKVRVDVRLDEVVLKSLEKEPERRYQHASEVKTDVDAVRVPAALSYQAKEVGPGTGSRAVGSPIRNPWKVLLFVGVVKFAPLFLLVFALIFAFLRSGHILLNFLELALILSAGLEFSAGIFILLGAVRMRHWHSYRLSCAACVVAMIPAGPSLVIGLPAGIWSLLTLRKPEVKRAFASSHREPTRGGPTLNTLEKEAKRNPKDPEVETVGGSTKGAPRETSTPQPKIPVLGFNFKIASAGSETAAEIRATKLRRFWAGAFGLWLLAWLLPVALWNFRMPGRFCAAIAIYSLLWWTLLKRLRFTPELAPHAGKLFRNEYGFFRKVFAGYLLTGIVHVGLIFMLLLLFDTASSAWENLQWHSLATNARTFLAENSGKEYRLLRELNAYRENIPAADLRSLPREFSVVPGWVPLTVVSFFAFALLQVPPFLVFGLVRAPFSWAHYWRPWLAFAATMASSGLIVMVTVFAYSQATLLGSMRAGLPPTHREIRAKFDAEAVDKIFSDWARQQSLSLREHAGLTLDAIQTGKKIAQIRLSDFWKSSPFERWKMTWLGFRRISPEVAVQIVTSEEPAEALIRLDVRPPMHPEDAAKKGALPFLDEIEAALNTAGTQAPVIDASPSLSFVPPGIYVSAGPVAPNQIWTKTRLTVLKGNVGTFASTRRRPDGSEVLSESLVEAPVVLTNDLSGNLILRVGTPESLAGYTGTDWLDRVVRVTENTLVLERGGALSREQARQAPVSQPVAENQENNDTPLMRAAASGNLAAVNALLEKGADVNGRNKKNGETALMKAADNGDIDVTKALLEKGAEKNARNKAGETALMKAAANGQIECVEALKFSDDSLRDNNGRTALMLAVIHGQKALLKKLIREAKEGLRGPPPVRFASTAMMRPHVIQLTDNEGKTVLNLAEESKQSEIAALLRGFFDEVIQKETELIAQGGGRELWIYYSDRGETYLARGDRQKGEADLKEAERLHR